MTILDFRAARPTVLNTNQPGRPSHDGRGSAINPQFQSQGALPARYAASHGTAGDKDRASFSNRALLEGFADVVGLRVHGLVQSVIFASVAALFVSFAALAGALSVLLQSKVIDQ